ETSIRSQQRKIALLQRAPSAVVKLHRHRLDPKVLTPQLPANGIPALSLFSGCGGLDLGFERAGFGHVAAYDILEVCGQTLRANRPAWNVFGGAEGDIAGVRWSKYRG